jgi:isopenicillin-N epimerase
MSTFFKIAIIDPMNNIPSQLKSGPWLLDPTITYLNHGSFGARSREVYEAQQRYTLEFEQSPVDFLDRQRDRIHDARKIVAAFIGASHEGFGFVENATTGIGCVIQSLSLQEGDEILTTNHVYNGVRQLLSHYCVGKNLHYREIDIPLPITSDAVILQRIENAFTKKTKLLVIDHVASESAIVFPVDEIVDLCRKKGICILIDGAHAPGMIDLHIDALAPDWYVGNLHKWVCAPLGAAFVWTNEPFRTSTHPMTVSHWLHQGYTDEFDWQGTRDVSPWLSAVDAICVGEKIGWDSIRKHNHQLVTWMHETLVTSFGVQPLSPLDGSMLGSMATVLLPSCGPQTLDDCIALRNQLYVKNAVEIHIFEFQGKGMLRVSAQLYSRAEDIDRLLGAFRSLNITK